MKPNFLWTILLFIAIRANYCQIGYYSHPFNCNNNCIFQLFWADNGTETAFVFRTKLTHNSEVSYWTAFALSEDEHMVNINSIEMMKNKFSLQTNPIKGNDDVAVVKVLNGSHYSLGHFRNWGIFGTLPLEEANPAVGFSDVEITEQDAMLSCSFKRQNRMAYYPLPNEYHLLFAHGRLDETQRLQHHSIRCASIQKFHIQTNLNYLSF